MLKSAHIMPLPSLQHFYDQIDRALWSPISVVWMGKDLMMIYLLRLMSLLWWLLLLIWIFVDWTG